MDSLKQGMQMLIAVAIFAVGFFLAWLIQAGRVDKAKAERDEVQGKYNSFVSETERLGKEAEKQAKAKEATQNRLKEESDNEYKTAINLLAADNKRLRYERARSSYVPPATPGARNPETACFDRAELESTIQRLDAGVSGIVEQGDQERVGLNSVKNWSASISENKNQK